MQLPYPIVFALFLTIACGPSDDSSRYDPALEGLSITAVNPADLVGGSQLVIRGRSFVGAPFGTPSILVEGRFDNGSEAYDIKFSHPVEFVDIETLATKVDSVLLDKIGGSTGSFEGTFAVQIDSEIDGKPHFSQPFPTSFRLLPFLSPSLSQFNDSGLLFVNNTIEIEAQGLLLGGGEGATLAQIDGCFVRESQEECIEISSTQIPLQTSGPFDRTHASFAFGPQVAGILPGEFHGSLTLINDHADGTIKTSETKPATYELLSPELFATTPQSVSIGQHLFLRGGGFVANESGSSTLLQITSVYTPDGGRPVPLEMTLVPEFVDGTTLRYTLNEDDTLGTRVDLRAVKGVWSGTVEGQVAYGSQSISSNRLDFSIALSPVKQVVYLDFTTAYLDALRSVGLRAMDAEIRKRVAAVIRRDYQGVNLDLRLERPSDFSLYSTVEIGGKDPNGLGLLGYDNTPGKDVGNQRLYDIIGGVNATTQLDGFPGFGGVFIESLFLFSEHPGEFAQTTHLSDPLFDEIFDVFRPDRNGFPVRAADLATAFSLDTAPTCPGQTRSEQIACATWTLANLIGSTISHEIGHSLGLANPEGSSSHHLSDAPNRLMDSGSSRPFDERAQLRGQGPSIFCTEAYNYLQTILPGTEPTDPIDRPSCF